MTNAGQRRFGILSGGGRLPKDIADSLRARGAYVHVIPMAGEADADFSAYPHTVVHWGQVGALLAAIRKARVTDLLIVGRVKRPDLSRLKFDFGFFLAVPAIIRIIRSGGDDGVLRSVVRFFETKGVRVVGPGDVAPELLIQEGEFGTTAPLSDDEKIFAKGFEVLSQLSPFDIGQAVVISDDLTVEAIEGIEGTDGLLERVTHQRRDKTGRQRSDDQGFLIKAPKLGQDLRVDLPTIGPQTIINVAQAGLRGLALEAGRVLVVDRDGVEKNISLHGLVAIGRAGARERKTYDELQNASEAASTSSTYSNEQFSICGAVTPPKQFAGVANRGLEVLAALEGVANQNASALIIEERHVLGVECGEGIASLCGRIEKYKPWGRARRKHRLRLLVMRARNADALAALEAEHLVGIDGIVVKLQASHLTLSARDQDQLNAADVFVVTTAPALGDDGGEG